MAPRWKWKIAKAKALSEPISKSISELQFSLARTESSGFFLSCIVLLAVEPEQVDQSQSKRCCFRPCLCEGNVNLQTKKFGPSLKNSNVTCEEYKENVVKAKEHIMAGDVFQIVLSQRFERRTFADPFEVYRALRVVNPSPYMGYLQARGCNMVASSP